jgi:hypothetical protein
MLSRRRPALEVTLAFLVACGSGSPPEASVATVSVVPRSPAAPVASAAPEVTPSASASAPVDTQSARAPGTGLTLGAACEPTDDRCAPELRCDSTCDGPAPRFACVNDPIGPVPGGGKCSGTERCVRGSRCVYESDASGQPTGGTCIAYCRTDADCAKTERCIESETSCSSDDGSSDGSTISYRHCRPPGRH